MDEIKIYPELLLEAERKNIQTSAIKAWYLVRHLIAGKGNTIPTRSLNKIVIKDLGVPRQTAHRWIKSAINLGILHLVINKSRVKFYEIKSVKYVSKLLQIPRLERPTWLPLSKFLEQDFMASVQACYQLRFGDQPVARQTLEQLTGTPKRTQQWRDARAGVINKPNICILGNLHQLKNNPDLLMTYQGYPGQFITKAGQICFQLPNSKEIPLIYRKARFGRTRKTNKFLNSLSFVGAVDTKKLKLSDLVIRYSNSPKQTKEIARNTKKKGIPNLIIYERATSNRWLEVRF